jgi:hypothetical protein
MRRGIGLALLVLALAVPASANAIDPEQTVAPGSKWTSGDLLSQTGENCSILGAPYTEQMVSGIASYGGTAGVPVVHQRYYTAFLVSVPGDPCGPGSSAIETDVVLPPNTTIDTSAPIRCFGEPRGASTFLELTGGSWSFEGYSGPYCPATATPSSLHSGAWSLGFRPLATGQLFQIFVPVISTAPLVGAGASPADGFRWLTDATGVYANPGLSTVWANVFAAASGSTPFVYFAHEAAIPFWKADASKGPPDERNRAEFFANVYTAGLAGNLCWKIVRISDKSVRADCTFDGGWNGSVAGGEPDLVQVLPGSGVTGPNGGYAPVYFNGPEAAEPEWGQDMKIVWTYTYGGGTKSVSAEAPFHTLPGPDGDGDGVPDSSDECPSSKGTLPNGCLPPVQADPDGDGVFGSADLCPAVNGQGSLNGCPGGVVPPPPAPQSTLQAPPPLASSLLAPLVISTPTVTHHKASAANVGGHVVVRTGLSIACAAAGAACSVVLAGTVSGPQAKGASVSKTKSVVVAMLRTSVPAGKTLALALRLNSKGAALLKKHHKLKIALAGIARAGNGPTTRLSATITISNPPIKHKHA